jgi:hypothetical protein
MMWLLIGAALVGLILIIRPRLPSPIDCLSKADTEIGAFACAMMATKFLSGFTGVVSGTTWKAKFEDTARQLAETRRLAEQRKAQIEAQQSQISVYAERLLRQQEEHAVVVAEEVKEAIREYAENTEIQRFYPSAEFIRLHDERARNFGMPGVADTPALAAGGPRRITDVELIGVIAENYQQCHRWRRKWVGWMAWWYETDELYQNRQ